MLLYALKSTEDSHDVRPLLKPTEVEEKALEVNCHSLNGAVSVFWVIIRLLKMLK